jgi:heme oxygenase
MAYVNRPLMTPQMAPFTGSLGGGGESRFDLLAKLRAATRTEHDAIEASLGLLRASLTVHRYHKIVERFYGYYAPLEAALAHARAAVAPHLDLPDSGRTALLARDLEALDGRPAADLPRCSFLPALETRGAVIGCMYVLEGATLGGQLVTRHVMATLGLAPDRGCAFFFGDGDRTAARWKSFSRLLSEFSGAQPTSHVDAIVAAVATFRTFRLWWDAADLRHGITIP